VPGKLKPYLRELRAPFLAASVLPVGLGAAVAYFHTGCFALHLFMISVLGVAALHAAANVANDYFDHKSGCDETNQEYVRPFTGGSRLIQEEHLTPREVLCESVLLFALALACGICLAAAVGWWVLALGAFGALSGYFYTAPPLRLSGRGVGELIVGLNFGLLVTLGSYCVQTGAFSWTPVVASVPVAILIAAVLFINQFQDSRADEASGKRNWVVRLGRRRAAKVFPVLMAAPYAAIAVALACRAVPAWSLLAVLTLPLALKASLLTRRFYSDSPRLAPANALTILTHLAVAALLGAGYLLAAQA
jgi:1,4-dihydroxy-2-naphthoate octaprenyltransferase